MKEIYTDYIKTKETKFEADSSFNKIQFISHINSTCFAVHFTD